MTMRAPRRQRGQETLQAVLAVSFMLLPVLLGTVQLGGLIHLWLGQESAASAGARAAGERGEDDALVRTRIAVALRASGIDPGRVEVEVVPSSVRWGQPITVQLISRRRIAVPFLFSRDLTLTTAAVARGEVDH
jgi:hypothetical protein